MSTYDIALARDVGQYLGVPESDLPPPIAVPQVVLRDGVRSLKVDADEYAAVYAATFGDFDVGVSGRTHRTALPKLAATASRLGKADVARALERFGQESAECVRVEDEVGQPWKPGQRPVVQERAAAGDPDDRALTAADVLAYFGARE